MGKSSRKIPDTTFSKRSKKKTKNSSAQFNIGPQARQERHETIQQLLPRERSQIKCRDKEFRRFLAEQYRINCPSLRMRYRGVSSSVLAECVDWIHDFHGVNKKTSDPFDVDKRFDIGEGRSWVDQRRSKKIVPLFVFWLDVIKTSVDEMRRKNPSLPQDLLLITVEKLLTTSYHPKSTQSNQTALVCMQSLHTPEMRLILKKFGIVVPDIKKHLGPFISALRDKVEDRRLCLTPSSDSPAQSHYTVSNGVDTDVPSDSESVDSDVRSVCSAMENPIDVVMAERDAARKERDDLQQKYDLLANQHQMTLQKIAMLTSFSWRPPQQQYVSPSPPHSGFYPDEMFTSSSSPSQFSEEFLPPMVESEAVDADLDVGMSDANPGVPLRLNSQEMNGFLNWDKFGY